LLEELKKEKPKPTVSMPPKLDKKVVSGKKGSEKKKSVKVVKKDKK